MSWVPNVVKSWIGLDGAAVGTPTEEGRVFRNQTGSPENAELRQHWRQPARFGFIELGQHNGGIVLNISEGGLAVQAVRSIVDALLPQIRFQFSESLTWTEANVRVAWTSASRKMAGLEFLDLPDESRARIREWISLELLSGNNWEGKGSPHNRDENSISTTYAALATTRRSGTSDPSEGPSAVVSLAAELPPSPADNTSTSRSHKWQWLSGASAVLVLLTVAFSESAKRIPHSPRAESPNGSHMGLKLERTGTDWQLSWNPDSPAISNAAKAHLLISDGSSRKYLDLDSSDLRGGTVIFTPMTNDVVLRLEVDRPDSPTTISESVRIAGGLPSSLPSQATRIFSSGNRNSTLVEASEAHSPADSGKVSERASALNTETNGLPATERLNLQQTSQASPHQSSADPVLTATSNSSLNAIPHISPYSISPLSPEPNETPQLDSITTPPSISVPAIPEVASPSTHPEPAEDTRIEPAHLIAKTDPVYPPVARQSGVTGTVEVHFRIGADGTVHDVKVIKGNPLLANAAARALGTWRYKPARLNGTSVESDGNAVVDFK